MRKLNYRSIKLKINLNWHHYHKVWSKVFEVVEFECKNGFSKFWKHFLVQKKLKDALFWGSNDIP